MRDPKWVQEWRMNITKLETLLDLCEINENQRLQIATAERFLLSVPRRIAAKMRKGDIEDPIFRQFVPVKGCESAGKGSLDPLEEQKSFCTGRLLQKYEGRALILATGVCGMHCRFCFRQHSKIEISFCNFKKELAWLANHKEISEVILSGGDPLALQNIELARLLTVIGEINHVRRIRIHSRFLIGFPERIDNEFIKILMNIGKVKIIVLHINHVNEIDEEVADAIQRLKKGGVILMSQSVLLKGINDSEEALSNLLCRLAELGVIPYYLHQLDKVTGCMQYEVSLSRGMALMKRLHESLPGYMVPRFVQEVPGEGGKIIYPTYAGPSFQAYVNALS